MIPIGTQTEKPLHLFLIFDSNGLALAILPHIISQYQLLN
jgi:hypothetical protein